MIISASRRTDIPAFYSEWFMNRIREGYVYAVNPFNRKQVSSISLKPEDVECIVFWTKDAFPIMTYLDELEERYKFYFQFTIDGYDKDVEPGLRDKEDIQETFIEMSKKLGKERMVWRYDPILLNEKYTVKRQMEIFESFFERLAPYTECCVISFIDLYEKTKRNTAPLGMKEITKEDMEAIAEGFSRIARGSGVKLQSCSEEIDLDKYGIEHGSCIDKARIERVLGGTIDIKKDPTQRAVCGCMKSVDVGSYNTCQHLCRYCYANFNEKMARAVRETMYDPASPILCGRLHGDEKITERKVEHIPVSYMQCEETVLF